MLAVASANARSQTGTLLRTRVFPGTPAHAQKAPLHSTPPSAQVAAYVCAGLLFHLADIATDHTVQGRVHVSSKSISIELT